MFESGGFEPKGSLGEALRVLHSDGVGCVRLRGFEWNPLNPLTFVPSWVLLLDDIAGVGHEAGQLGAYPSER